MTVRGYDVSEVWSLALYSGIGFPYAPVDFIQHVKTGENKMEGSEPRLKIYSSKTWLAYQGEQLVKKRMDKLSQDINFTIKFVSAMSSYPAAAVSCDIHDTDISVSDSTQYTYTCNSMHAHSPAHFFELERGNEIQLENRESRSQNTSQKRYKSTKKLRIEKREYKSELRSENTSQNREARTQVNENRKLRQVDKNLEAREYKSTKIENRIEKIKNRVQN